MKEGEIFLVEEDLTFTAEWRHYCQNVVTLNDQTITIEEGYLRTIRLYKEDALIYSTSYYVEDNNDSSGDSESIKIIRKFYDQNEYSIKKWMDEKGIEWELRANGKIRNSYYFSGNNKEWIKQQHARYTESVAACPDITTWKPS